MKTDDTLLLQALKLKQLGSTGHTPEGDLVEQLLLQNPEVTKEKMRNICAFIGTELFANVEQICSILSLSKRQIVEMALIDVVEKANRIINETEALKSFEVN